MSPAPSPLPGRAVLLLGMGAGLLWSLGLVWLGTRPGAGQGLPLAQAMALALLPGGLVMALLVARLAQRRFFDDALIDGQPFSGAAAVDQRVLANTVEQLLLAAAIWPAAGLAWGSRLVLALGLGLGASRLLFWWGCHRARPLRGFGFAAGYYPTLLAALLAVAGLWAAP